MRPTDAPVTFDLPPGGMATEQAQSLIAATAAGKLSPGQGSTLLNAIAVAAKIELESEAIADLKTRLDVLEAAR